MAAGRARDSTTWRRGFPAPVVAASRDASGPQEAGIQARCLDAMAQPPKRRILAVASSGGHWIQLRRLSPAFEGHDVAYMTTDPGHRDEVSGARFYTVLDANRWERLKLVRSAAKILWVLLRE